MRTHKQQFLARYKLPADTSLSLMDISLLTGFPPEALQEVYNRGIGAWKTNLPSVRLRKDFSKNPDTRSYPRSRRLGKEQWAAARVYAFVNRSPKVFWGSDNDVREEFHLQ